MRPLPPIVLRICDLDGVAREHRCPTPKLQIGSHPSTGLTFSGRGVADYHCALESTYDGYILRDRGSGSGTFVNNERLTEPRNVRPGDRIYIGQYQLELLPPPAAPVLVRPPPPRTHRRPSVALGSVAILALSFAALWLARPVVAPDPAPTIPPLAAAPQVPAAPGPPVQARPRRLVQHEVIPGETIADIAARYDVSPPRLIADNDLNPDAPLTPARVLHVEAVEAVDPPLPRLRLVHRVEPGDTWTSLGERFGVDVELLRRFNPTLGEDLAAATEFILWVDPQIESRHDEPVRVHFPVVGDARSVGTPSSGRLERGLRLPASLEYQSVRPKFQYGSSHTIEHLRTAIARFRRLYRYDGVVVVSDLSAAGGGPLSPHGSHQSGRDVDVWLPALKGTYQSRHLAEDRKPRDVEINWFAAWGLVESLLATGQIQYIFLDSSLLPNLYRAGKRMGAAPEHLAAIQWQPPGQPGARHDAPVRHAANHVGHFHVRFKCGPADDRCTNRAAVEAP